MNGMSDSHALSGAFAVDALDDDERAVFEKHLAACPACRAEVASFHETAALVAEATADAPPASLRAGVLAGIREVRPLPPETARPEAPAASDDTAATVVPLRRRVLPTLLATAAAVVLLAAGLLVWQPWQSARTSVADQVRHAPDAVTSTQHLPGGGEMTLVRSPSLERAVLVAHDLPSPGAGKTYQLWLAQPGGMVSAGLVSDTSDTTVLTGDAATATAAAVSVEPATGSAQPTTDPVALFPFSAGGKGGA
jgi:anti-sigma factor RsiW